MCETPARYGRSHSPRSRRRRDRRRRAECATSRSRSASRGRRCRGRAGIRRRSALRNRGVGEGTGRADSRLPSAAIRRARRRRPMRAGSGSDSRCPLAVMRSRSMSSRRASRPRVRRLHASSRPLTVQRHMQSSAVRLAAVICDGCCRPASRDLERPAVADDATSVKSALNFTSPVARRSMLQSSPAPDGRASAMSRPSRCSCEILHRPIGSSAPPSGWSVHGLRGERARRCTRARRETRAPRRNRGTLGTEQADHTTLPGVLISLQYAKYLAHPAHLSSGKSPGRLFRSLSSVRRTCSA